MNSLVVIVAGVFVVIGVALIVLSVILARKQASPDEPPAEPRPPEDADGAAFIDQPLQTDMAAELGSAAAAGATANTDAAAATADTEAAPLEDAPLEQSAAVAATAAPAAPLDGAAGLRQVSHDFRLQLAAKYLESDRLDEAVGEFEKAVAVAVDPSSKLDLYVEIGNVRRAQRRYGEARAAYDQAATYTHDEALLDHLTKTSEEMRGLEARDDTGGSARTGKED